MERLFIAYRGGLFMLGNPDIELVGHTVCNLNDVAPSDLGALIEVGR